MTPEEALKSIGLNEKEAKIYLAALELGQETISNIARKAGLKRPTAYLLLDSLRQRGLINLSTKGKRTLYGVEEPQKLMFLVAEKQRVLKDLLPYLEAVNNRHALKPRVRFYEGKEGLRRIYEEAFQSKEIRFWGSIPAFTKEFEDILEWFITIANKKKIKVFDLLTDTEADRRYADRVMRPGYEIRFFPKELPIFIDSFLFENKLAMVSFSPEPHGLIIESEQIVKSFRSLWELAWRGATPLQRA